MPGLAPGSRAPDAREQPRSGRRRGSREPRGLRRHGQGGPHLGRLPPHRRDAEAARRRRDAAGAVRAAGRRVPHARDGAARADRELEPRARLGQLGRVPAARGAGSDDVRPDDRGVVDLHRHAGHRPGHVRDVRSDRRAALRRVARREAGRHRRLRRHGRRAAARGGDAGWGLPDRRRRSAPPRAPRRDPLPRPGGARSRHGIARGRGGEVGRRGALDRPRHDRERAACGAACPRRRPRHRHRPDGRARPARRLRAGRPLAGAGGRAARVGSAGVHRARAGRDGAAGGR